MLKKITANLVTKFEHQVLIAAGIGLAVFAGVGIYGDTQETGLKLLNFDWQLLPVILFLTMLNYVIRTFRWQFFLLCLGISIDLSTAWWVFISGLAMTVTPGRVGELVKSYFLKRLVHVEISTTAPLVVFERLSDGLAMLILMSGGLMLTRYGVYAVALALLVALAFIVLLHQRKLMEWILRLTLRLPMVSRYFGHLNNFYQSSVKLVGWKVLIVGCVMSMVAWAAEGLGFYLVLRGLGMPASMEMLLLAMFIFGFAAIVGFATFLPGGLGVAEGSMVGLLVHLLEAPSSTAAAATLLIRLSTLWVGVAWGLIAIVYLQKKVGKVHGKAAEDE